MYKFRRATEEERNEWHGGSHKIWGIGNDPSGERAFALFLGKAMTVFGQPDWMDTDWENMYSYLIITEDEQGNIIYLEIYHGPSGSAIGGQDINKQAAEELAELILSAKPTDYEWESIYEDIPVNVKYIVRDGKAYVESEFPEGMDDFEDMEDFM